MTSLLNRIPKYLYKRVLIVYPIFYIKRSIPVVSSLLDAVRINISRMNSERTPLTLRNVNIPVSPGPITIIVRIVYFNVSSLVNVPRVMKTPRFDRCILQRNVDRRIIVYVRMCNSGNSCRRRSVYFCNTG